MFRVNPFYSHEKANPLPLVDYPHKLFRKLNGPPYIFTLLTGPLKVSKGAVMYAKCIIVMPMVRHFTQRYEERVADHQAELTTGSRTTVVVDRGLASDLASLASPEREKGQPAL